MNTKLLQITLLSLGGLSLLSAAEREPSIPNPLISYDQFTAKVLEVDGVRESRRLTEDAFLAAMIEPGVVVLDARSGPMFVLRHLDGAVNLTLPDFTEAALAAVIPSKDTKVLIYCNNNFTGSPIAMASKAVSASLNVHTFVTLRSYGYNNVWELGPLLDVRTTKLPMAGKETEKAKP